MAKVSKKQNKIIVILGPTASGKTGIGVKLAGLFDGEIVSADSRQVYRGMDIGTGKDLQDYRLKIPNSKFQIPNKKNKFISIPYHLIDVVEPTEDFSLAQYQKMAFTALNDILKRGKLPILVGGSGLYLQAVIDNYQLKSSKPNKADRKKYEKYDIDKLYQVLYKLDRKVATSLNESDRKNKRRLIRKIEMLLHGEDSEIKKGKELYNALVIGIDCPREELNKRIHKRLIERLDKQNMIKEVEDLHKNGVSWERMEQFGLEYKFIASYLQGRLDYDEMIQKLFIAICQFAKRQMTWFRRWERQGRVILWKKDLKSIQKEIIKFLK